MQWNEILSDSIECAVLDRSMDLDCSDAGGSRAPPAPSDLVRALMKLDRAFKQIARGRDQVFARTGGIGGKGRRATPSGHVAVEALAFVYSHVPAHSWRLGTRIEIALSVADRLGLRGLLGQTQGHWGADAVDSLNRWVAESRDAMRSETFAKKLTESEATRRMDFRKLHSWLSAYRRSNKSAVMLRVEISAAGEFIDARTFRSYACSFLTWFVSVVNVVGIAMARRWDLDVSGRPLVHLVLLLPTDTALLGSAAREVLASAWESSPGRGLGCLKPPRLLVHEHPGCRAMAVGHADTAYTDAESRRAAIYLAYADSLNAAELGSADGSRLEVGTVDAMTCISKLPLKTAVARVHGRKGPEVAEGADTAARANDTIPGPDDRLSEDALRWPSSLLGPAVGTSMAVPSLLAQMRGKQGS